MKVCNNCRNAIPDGMKICPHCTKMPTQLFPNFYIYLALTIVATVSAVCFRPFAVGKAAAQLSTGMLWVSFCIFAVFALIFAFVCLTVLSDYKNTKPEHRMSVAEINRYNNTRRHINEGRHVCGPDGFCTVCGKRRK